MAFIARGLTQVASQSQRTPLLVPILTGPKTDCALRIHPAWPLMSQLLPSFARITVARHQSASPLHPPTEDCPRRVTINQDAGNATTFSHLAGANTGRAAPSID